MVESKISPSMRWAFLSLLIIIPVGFCSKFYQGPAALWVNNSLSGAFYEIFWSPLIFFLLNKAQPVKIALSVLIFTCILEFLQLWHPPFLEYLRRFIIGQTIQGTTFAWSDFPYYFLGSGIGWLWLGRLRNLNRGSLKSFQKE